MRREQIFARVTQVERKGKRLAPGSFWWGFFEKVWIVTAPVFSKQKEVAAALEAKVRLIGSLHNAKAYVDIDSSESPRRQT